MLYKGDNIFMPKYNVSVNKNIFNEDNIRSNILPHYNLENASIKQVKYKDSEKERAVYKIEYNDLAYCLKKVYYNEDELLFVYSAIEWLNKRNIKSPRLLPTTTNGRYVRFENMLFILTPWIEGEKCDYNKIENIIDAAAHLGKMHSLCVDFKPIEGSALKTGCEDYYITTLKHFNQILQSYNYASTIKDKFSRLFLQHFDTNLKLAKIALEFACKSNPKDLTICLCHNDYVNKNLLYDDSNEIWIIDFDKCKIDYAVHDISYFLRRILKRDSTRWNIELAISSIHNYLKYSNLTKSDFYYICAYLCFPQKFWKLSRDYYRNISKCNKGTFYSLFSKSIEKCECQLEFAYSLIYSLNKNFNLKL